MSTLEIDGVRIGDDHDAYVIAEIGHNHQGNLETAKTLFKKAAESGASAVKLQKRDSRTLFTQEMYDSPYLNENSYGETYGAHREALESLGPSPVHRRSFAPVRSLSLAFDD